MYVERGNGDRTKNDKKEKTVRFSTLKIGYVKKTGATPTRSTYFLCFSFDYAERKQPFFYASTRRQNSRIFSAMLSRPSHQNSRFVRSMPATRAASSTSASAVSRSILL